MVAQLPIPKNILKKGYMTPLAIKPRLNELAEAASMLQEIIYVKDKKAFKGNVVEIGCYLSSASNHFHQMKVNSALIRIFTKNSYNFYNKQNEANWKVKIK